MQIVINIPDKEYEEIIDNKLNKSWDMTHYERVIANGIPLPKGHGDLVDRNDLKYEKYNSYAYAIANAPTIIEADKR